MLQEITIEELLKTNPTELDKFVLIDVRSEKEFQEGTIPNAVNIPLFDNAERATIGTIYTQESPKKAMEVGLEIVSRKLPDLYRQADRFAQKRPLVLFCYRGGMRSKSLSVILDLMGLPVLRLSGGYKGYRRFITDCFSQEFPFHIVVLRGNTGTGKTDLLLRLKQEGYPVVDLEGLSNNRGSVFGYIGQDPQPTQKQFEAMLYDEINRYHDHDYLIMECESKRIGRVTLPNPMFSAMREGTQVLLFDSMENRVNRLVSEYASSDLVEELAIPLDKLKKRLGKDSLDQLLASLNSKNYKDFAQRLIVEYYDHLYGYPNEESDDYDLSLSYNSPEICLRKMKEFLDTRFPKLG